LIVGLIWFETRGVAALLVMRFIFSPPRAMRVEGGEFTTSS
jgi:hypothetical protein